MDLPPSSHFIYIPGVLILGTTLGWFLGSRATRDAYMAEQRKAEDREKRRAERAAAKAASPAEPAAPPKT